MKKAKTVKKMIFKYMEKHGYDGLYTWECGCDKVDPWPCVIGPLGCKFGVKVPCDCGEHGFHIVPKDGER
jgi:hypothetical protein